MNRTLEKHRDARSENDSKDPEPENLPNLQIQVEPEINGFPLDDFKRGVHDIPLFSIQRYQTVFPGALSEPDLFGVFQGVASFAAFDPLHEFFGILRHEDHVDARLVDCERIRGGENPDVVHIGFLGVSVAIAVHAQTVQNVDKGDALFVPHVIANALGRFRHGFQELQLVFVALRQVEPAAPKASRIGATAGVNQRLAGFLRGFAASESDGQVLNRSAETSHRMALEVAEDEIRIVILEVASDIIEFQVLSAVHRNLHVIVLVEQVEGGDFQKAVILDNLLVHCAGSASAAVRRIAFHDRRAEFVLD